MFDPVLLAALSGTAFSPLSLFASGERGAWYDPSDFTTMFQDSAGTTPVTAVAQPVGLILDKSKGLALGSEIASTFTVTTDWTFGSGTVTGLGTAGGGTATSGVASVSNTWYKITYTKTGTSGLFQVRIGNTFVLTDGGAGAATRTYYAAAANTSGLVFTNSGSYSGTITGISCVAIAGNHAYQATSTSRPVLQQDGSGYYHLTFDGVDDSLSTASIDFSATDKMSVFAGVRKLTDVNAAIAEVSSNGTSVNGAFVLQVWDVGRYGAGSRGTIASTAISTVSTSTPPITNVLTGTGDISGDIAILQTNGSQVASSAANQGTGNYGSYPIYIGARGGGSLWLNGRIYCLIVRGVASTADQISRTETWVNGKTGAY